MKKIDYFLLFCFLFKGNALFWGCQSPSAKQSTFLKQKSHSSFYLKSSCYEIAPFFGTQRKKQAASWKIIGASHVIAKRCKCYTYCNFFHCKNNTFVSNYYFILGHILMCVVQQQSWIWNAFLSHFSYLGWYVLKAKGYYRNAIESNELLWNSFINHFFVD